MVAKSVGLSSANLRMVGAVVGPSARVPFWRRRLNSGELESRVLVIVCDLANLIAKSTTLIIAQSTSDILHFTVND